MSVDRHIKALGIKRNDEKKHAYKLTFYSAELGKPFKAVVFSNNPDRDYIETKFMKRQKQRNEAFKRAKNNPKEVVAQPPKEEIKPVLGDQIHRVDFKLILNKGTDTTTCAIVASSYAGGKSHLMMNSIVPVFYGAQRKYNEEKKMWKPVKQMKVKSDATGKDILYINTLFSLNTQIKVYKGYTDLIRVTGFEAPQQSMINKMREIQVKTDNKYRFALFIDDILDIRHSKMIDNLFLTLRNCEISTTICVQYLHLISKKCRGNIQNLVFGKLLSDEAIQAVIDTYLKSFFTKMGVKKEDHINLYRELTDNYQWIHLHQGTNQIFFCKAAPLY